MESGCRISGSWATRFTSKPSAIHVFNASCGESPAALNPPRMETIMRQNTLDFRSTKKSRGQMNTLSSCALEIASVCSRSNRGCGHIVTQPANPLPEGKARLCTLTPQRLRTQRLYWTARMRFCSVEADIWLSMASCRRTTATGETGAHVAALYLTMRNGPKQWRAIYQWSEVTLLVDVKSTPGQPHALREVLKEYSDLLTVFVREAPRQLRRRHHFGQRDPA